MLLVGHFEQANALGKKYGDPVYECPKCRTNTAGMFVYNRLASAPPRATDTST